MVLCGGLATTETTTTTAKSSATSRADMSQTVIAAAVMMPERLLPMVLAAEAIVRAIAIAWVCQPLAIPRANAAVEAMQQRRCAAAQADRVSATCQGCQLLPSRPSAAVSSAGLVVPQGYPSELMSLRS